MTWNDVIAKYNKDHFVIKMILSRAREGKVSKIITLTDFKMFGGANQSKVHNLFSLVKLRIEMTHSEDTHKYDLFEQNKQFLLFTLISVTGRESVAYIM